MNRFLLNNIGDRDHKTIYSPLSKHAIFDCSPTQLGWEHYKDIHIGDHVFIIDSSRRVSKEFRVTMIADEVALKGDCWGEFESVTGGDARVLFGVLVSEPKVAYGDFVLEHSIKYGKKFNPVTGKLTSPGFNCCEF